MELLKKILFGTLSIFILFVLWMNVTTGHFQETCCGHVEYSTRNTSLGCITLCDSRTITEVLFNKFLITTSVFDLYK